jgi:CO/xanthine dehydrogenase FAD-binding subunit
MRAYVPGYEMQAPRDLAAALDLFAREPGVWRPIAGGTDLMVLLEAGKLPHRRYVDIWNLRELRGIAETPAHITIGALATFTDIRVHATLQREFPLLCRAAAETGGVATQNRGTLGGNPGGVVSGETFRWWKRMVEENPSSIIISAFEMHHDIAQ